MTHVFTAREIARLKVIGHTVIYRALDRSTLPKYSAGMIYEYDAPRGTADIFVVGHGYHFQNVPYCKDLNKENSWCFKTDLDLVNASDAKPAPAPATAGAPASLSSDGEGAEA